MPTAPASTVPVGPAGCARPLGDCAAAAPTYPGWNAAAHSDADAISIAPASTVSVCPAGSARTLCDCAAATLTYPGWSPADHSDADAMPTAPASTVPVGPAGCARPLGDCAAAAPTYPGWNAAAHSDADAISIAPASTVSVCPAGSARTLCDCAAATLTYPGWSVAADDFFRTACHWWILWPWRGWPMRGRRIGEATHPGPVSLDGGTFSDARWVQLPAPPVNCPSVDTGPRLFDPVGSQCSSFGRLQPAIPMQACAVAAPASGDACCSCAADLLAHGMYWTLCTCDAHVCVTCAIAGPCPRCAALIPVHPSFRPASAATPPARDTAVPPGSADPGEYSWWAAESQYRLAPPRATNSRQSRDAPALPPRAV